MPDKIHLTVATVIHRDNQFLMVREIAEGREVINQPAGHVEPGESLLQAALRETLEETGWHVCLSGFLGIYTYRSPGNGATYYRLAFVAEPLDQAADVQLDPDILAAEWLDLESITAEPEKLRSPLVLSVIENYLTGPIYPLELIKELPGFPQP